MQNNFLDPILGSSTKSAIIEALTEKPLTLKELCSKVEKTTTKPLTYQAIHKATTEMIEARILQKNEKELMINKEWVEKIENFTKTMRETPKNSTPNHPEIKKYVFNSFAEVGKFVIKCSHDFENPENKIGLCIFKHSWPLFGMTKQDYDLLEDTVKNCPYFELVEGNTPLDHMFSKPLLDMGKPIIHGAKTTSPFDIILKGDYVQQVFFPKKVLDKLDQMYNSCKSLDDFSVVNLLKDFVVEHNEIPMIIIKDSSLADKIRENALKELLEHKEKLPKKLLTYLRQK